MQLSERTYPVLSRVCIGVGVVFLCLSAFGNWRFGWSLSTDPVDQWWLAIIYGGSDVAAGVLVATGATMLRHPGWRWKVGGTVALIPATILVALSVLSTFGMMSGRIAVLAGQKAVLKADAGELDWLRKQTANRELPRSERLSFRAEAREAAKKTRQTAAVVTDNQAVAIVNAAALTGVKLTIEQTQVGLTFASSTIPMMIKFVCLGIGFFLFGARTSEAAPTKKTQDGSEQAKGGSGGGEQGKLRVVHPEPASAAPRTMEAASSPFYGRAENGSEPEPTSLPKAEPPKVSTVGSRVSTDAPTGKLTYEQFADMIREDMLHGEPTLSTRALAARAGWSQTSVVQQQRKVRSKVNNSPVRRYPGNGGGMHTSANG